MLHVNGATGATQSGAILVPDTSPTPINHNIFDRSILLIEDRQGSRDTYSGLLTRQGYRIIRAHGAAEATERLKIADDVAVVIVDVEAQHDGISLARDLYKSARNRPWIEYLVVLGGNANSESDIKIAADESDWLMQISDRTELPVAVSEAYNIARMQRFKAEELQSLESSLAEFKVKTNAAVLQLIAGAQRRLTGPDTMRIPNEGTRSVGETAESARFIEHECMRARTRNRIFSPLALGHAGWMLILTLAEAELSGVELTVKSAAYSAGLPLSSALRKINEMCAAELLNRRSDPADGRRSFVTLTARTRSQLLQYSLSLKQTYEERPYDLSAELG